MLSLCPKVKLFLESLSKNVFFCIKLEDSGIGGRNCMKAKVLEVVLNSFFINTTRCEKIKVMVEIILLTKGLFFF